MKADNAIGAHVIPIAHGVSVRQNVRRGRRDIYAKRKLQKNGRISGKTALCNEPIVEIGKSISARVEIKVKESIGHSCQHLEYEYPCNEA